MTQPLHDQDARQPAKELLPQIYAELRQVAQARLAKAGPGQTLQPTALVHEAYARIVQNGDPGWDNERHFWSAAATMMRNILVDRARQKASIKHGGGRKRLSFGEASLATVDTLTDEQLLTLDAAISALQAKDPELAEIVRLRCFAGCTMKQIARATDQPLSKIEHRWRFVRTWLHGEITDPSV